MLGIVRVQLVIGIVWESGIFVENKITVAIRHFDLNQNFMTFNSYFITYFMTCGKQPLSCSKHLTYRVWQTRFIYVAMLLLTNQILRHKAKFSCYKQVCP